MLTVLLSWGIIGFISFVLGKITITFFNKKDLSIIGTYDVYITMGLMICTVYAQIFSLFHGVNALTCCLILLLACIFFFIYKKHKFIHNLKLSNYSWIILITVLVITMLWTVGRPEHYDTLLYHAQAIRWIEEYGVVPGLGNLHNRFAYNSAFMPLQALFSFKWIFGQSLHSLNGFICMFFLGYAFITNKIFTTKFFHLSDCVWQVEIVTTGK